MSGVTIPDDRVAEQKIALVRVFFYLPDTLWVTRSVTVECARIRNIDRAKLHQSFISALFGELPIQQYQSVESRTNELCGYHKGRADCAILAEAEATPMDVFLSFDSDFLRNLRPHSAAVRLLDPVQYWTMLGIPRGAKPQKVPEKTNPLALETWWKW